MKIGKYTARILHFGQPKDTDIFLCSKCLEKGHFTNNCPNEWKCRKCNELGHKMMDCPQFIIKQNDDQINIIDEDEDMLTDSQTTMLPEKENDTYDH